MVNKNKVTLMFYKMRGLAAKGGPVTSHFSRSGLVLIELLVVIGIIGILFGLIFSGIQKVRSAANLIQCQNKMRQIGLAFINRHDLFQTFPPGHRSLSNLDEMPYTGWTIDLLPFLELEQLKSQSNFAFSRTKNPFSDPPHPLSLVVNQLVCPADSRTLDPQTSLITNHRVGLLSYLGVSGTESAKKNGVLYQDSKTSIGEILDGTSNTIILGERPPSFNFQFGWWYAGVGQKFTGSADLILGVHEPNLLPIQQGSPCGSGNYGFQPSTFSDPCGMFHFWSPHPGGSSFLFGDGSVRFISYNESNILNKLATINGDDSLD